ncbi:MAG: dihydrodipicolinate synthase family protein [Candidatus Omnitrophica bacterium]|nr:dihydrodipicolinate synthase family protein [Candidatus Omnitrophota bacterium]
MDIRIFKGVYPASLTPFKKDGSVNYGVIPKMVEFHLKNGVTGFYLCGNTGQGLILSVEERKEIIKTYVEAVKGKAEIIVHIGDNSTNVCCELAKYSERIGADAISSLPPIVYSEGFESTYQHYKSICQSTSLPLFIYNMPGMVEGNITLDNFLRLFKLKNIVGMKFTSYNLYEMRNIIEATKGKLLVLSGPDEIALPALVMGAGGNIGSTQNIFSLAFVNMYKKFLEGNIFASQKIQYKLNRIIRILLKYRKDSLKVAIKMAGFDCGRNRLPGLNLNKEEEKNLRKELEKADFYQLLEKG